VNGFVVATAQTAEEGLRLAREILPGPGVDGFQPARHGWPVRDQISQSRSVSAI